MTPLRIAHVLLSLDIGGGERVALELAKTHARAGHRLFVVSFEEPANGALGAQFEAAKVTVVRVPKLPGIDWRLPTRIARALWPHAIDVMHTHNPPPLSYAAVAGRMLGARVIHTKHGPHPDRGPRLMLRRAGAACTHAFVAVSEDSNRAAREMFEVSPRKLSTILNGTDMQQFRPDAEARTRVRAELGIGQNDFVVGTVGRMADVKNHPLLIRALAPALSGDLHLVIVGGGDEAERTRALATTLGVREHVHFTGPTDRVSAHLCAFDVFALSSRTEGLPLVLTEAMGTELPVVATAVGGVPKVVVDGQTGFLVPPNDEKQLRDKLLWLRDHPQERREFGLRARTVAEQEYSSKRMADEYLALYRG